MFLVMKQKVVLDTSALIIHGKGKQNVFELLDKFVGLPQFIVPNFVEKELKTIAEKGKGKTKTAANVALKQFDKVKVTKVKKTSKTVDTSLLNYAEKIGAWICTNDRGLRDRAKKRGIKVVYVSEKYFKQKRPP